VKKGNSMMGVNLFDAFKSKTHIEETRVFNIPAKPKSTTTVSFDEFPTLLRDFGRFKGFRH